MILMVPRTRRWQCEVARRWTRNTPRFRLAQRSRTNLTKENYISTRIQVNNLRIVYPRTGDSKATKTWRVPVGLTVCTVSVVITKHAQSVVWPSDGERCYGTRALCTGTRGTPSAFRLPVSTAVSVFNTICTCLLTRASNYTTSQGTTASFIPPSKPIRRSSCPRHEPDSNT